MNTEYLQPLTVQPYPPGTRWTIRGRNHSHVQTEELALYAEPNGASMTDDYLPEEISAAELWRLWVDKYAVTSHETRPDRFRAGEVSIYWTVTTPKMRGIFEGAPHATHGYGEDFLTHYLLPENAETGEPLNWLRLPVLDRGWNDKRADKGGFIQEATGWKPSPLQATMDFVQIGLAAGLYVPDPR